MKRLVIAALASMLFACGSGGGSTQPVATDRHQTSQLDAVTVTFTGDNLYAVKFTVTGLANARLYTTAGMWAANPADDRITAAGVGFTRGACTVTLTGNKVAAITVSDVEYVNYDAKGITGNVIVE